MKLKNILFCSHMLIFFIPMLLIVAVFYSTNYRMLSSETEIHINQMLNSMTKDLEGLIEEAEKTAILLEHELNLQQALREPPSPFTSEIYAFNLRMDDWLNFVYSYSTTRLDAFYVLGRYVQFKSNLIPFNNHSFINEAWYTNTINSEHSVWYSPHDGCFVNDNPEQFITMTKALKHTLQEDAILGVTVIDIKQKSFQDIIHSVTFAEGSQIYIQDRSGQTILSNVDAAQITPSAGKPGVLVFERPLSNGWSLHANVPILDTIIQKQLTTTSVLLMVFLIMFALISYFSHMLSSRIFRPINSLMIAMKQIETGDFDVQLTAKSSIFEINSLYNSFGVMVQRLESLIQEGLQKQRNLRKAQISALQSQINPHFLYNTLDTITWNVRLGRSEEAISALMALTKLFRISISKGKEHISIKDEIEHVRMYLNIQKIRYSDRLDYMVNMNKSVEDYQTIKLIVQPLVENSIYHGIKELDRPGEIIIQVYEEENKIVICIHDNGVGMTEQETADLNALLTSNTTLDSKVYGILNVNTRIRMEYGSEYGIHYESSKALYTTATITLPKIPLS